MICFDEIDELVFGLWLLFMVRSVVFVKSFGSFELFLQVLDCRSSLSLLETGFAV